MKIFIIYCLLFIHVKMCIFSRGFRVSIWVSGIHGFSFGDGFPPESVSGSGFDFGFRFWVHGDSIRSEPDPLPFLILNPPSRQNKKMAVDMVWNRVSSAASTENNNKAFLVFMIYYLFSWIIYTWADKKVRWLSWLAQTQYRRAPIGHKFDSYQKQIFGCWSKKKTLDLLE